MANINRETQLSMWDLMEKLDKAVDEASYTDKPQKSQAMDNESVISRMTNNSEAGSISDTSSIVTVMPCVRDAEIEANKQGCYDFESELKRSRPYRKMDLGPNTSTISLVDTNMRSWSILSGYSLAVVSNVSVISLNLPVSQLYNPLYYTMPSNPASFAESKPSDVSRRTDVTSYSVHEDGSPITISTTKKRDRKQKEREGTLTPKTQQSQTSLLIEYFEGEKELNKPRVRVKLKPSSARKSKDTKDHIQITEGSGHRTKGVEEKSLSPLPAADDSDPGGRQAPLKMKVIYRDQGSELSEPNILGENEHIPHNPSEGSSMPPNNMLQTKPPKSSLNNSQFPVGTLEDAIRRLILPELNKLEHERKIQQSRSNLERDRRESFASGSGLSRDELIRRGSKHANAPNLADRSEVVLNRDEQTTKTNRSSRGKKSRRSSPGLESPSQRSVDRGISGETVIRDGDHVRRRRTKDSHKLRDGGGALIGPRAVTAADLEYRGLGLGIDQREWRKKRSKSRSHHRSESTDDVFYKHDVPPMPMCSEISNSDVTRDSLLSERTSSLTNERRRAEIRQLSRGFPREVLSPECRTPTRSPAASRDLIVYHCESPSGDVERTSTPTNEPRRAEIHQATRGSPPGVLYPEYETPIPPRAAALNLAIYHCESPSGDVERTSTPTKEPRRAEIHQATRGSPQEVL
jgi:hypothetical protein